MRTLKEKVEHNNKRYKTDDFSAGYIIGVQMYHDYPNKTSDVTEITARIIKHTQER